MDSDDTTVIEQNGQDDPGKEEEVEDILIEVLGSRTQPAHILVQWRGVPVSEASWVPANVMNEEVRAWWAEKKARIASGELPEFDLDAWEAEQQARDQSMSTTHATMTGVVEDDKPVGLCPAEDGKHDEEDVSPARRSVPASRNKSGKRIIDSDDSDISMHSDSGEADMPLVECVKLSTPMLDERRRSSLGPSTPNTVIGDTINYLRHGSPEVQKPPPARKRASAMKPVLTAEANLKQKLNDANASIVASGVNATASLKRKLSDSSAIAELQPSSKKLAGPNGKKVERSPPSVKHKTAVVPSKTPAALKPKTVASKPAASTKKKQPNKDAKAGLPRKDHRFWRKQQDRPPNPADKVVGIDLTTKVLPNIDVITRRQQEGLDNIIVSPPAPQRKRVSTGKLTKPTMLTEHTAVQQLEQARKSSIVGTKAVNTKAVSSKAVNTKAVSSKAVDTKVMSTKTVSTKATTSRDTGCSLAPAKEVESTLFVPIEPDAEAFIVQAQDRMAAETVTVTESSKTSSALINNATLTPTRSPTTSGIPVTKATLISSPSKDALLTKHSAKVQFVKESDTAKAKNGSPLGKATVVKGARAVSMTTRLPTATAIEHSTSGASTKGSRDGPDQTKTLEQKGKPQLPAANGMAQHFLPPIELASMRKQPTTTKPGDIHPVYRRRSPGRERHRSVSSPSPRPPQAAVSRTVDPFKIWAKEKETTCRAWRLGFCKQDELSCKHRHALLPDKAFPMASQEITCSYWLQQNCYRFFCPFAHHDTGVHAMRNWSENQHELRQIFAGAPPSFVSSLMYGEPNSALSADTADDETGVQSSLHTSTTMTDGSDPTTMVTQSPVPRARAASTLSLARSMTGATFVDEPTQTGGTRASDTVELPPVDLADHVLATIFKHKGPALSTFVQQADRQLRLSMQLCYASQREYTRAADAIGDWDRGQLYLYEEAVIEERLFAPYEPLGYVESCSSLVAEYLAAPAGQAETDRVRAAVIKYDNGFIRMALGDKCGYRALGIRPMPCALKQCSLLFRVFTTQRPPDDQFSSLFSSSAGMLAINLDHFFKKVSKDGRKPSVCIFAVDMQADGPVLLSNILKAGGVLVTIQNNAYEVNGAVYPDAFFLFSYETRYDKIPGLYKHLASHQGHTLSLRNWRINQAPPELVKVFPNAVAILITDEVFSRPATVLEIFKSARALASPDNKRRLEERLLLSPQVLTTTDLKGLLKSLMTRDHDERHREVLEASEALTRDRYAYFPEKPWTELVAKEEHDEIRSEPGRASNLFVTEFAQWAVRHAGEMGRFIVIHEPDSAGREVPRRWMDQFGHLEVMSPEHWLRSARQEM